MTAPVPPPASESPQGGTAVGKRKSRRRKRWILAAAAATVMTMLLIPLPIPVNDADVEHAVSHAITAVTNDRRVLSSDGYGRLADSDSVSKEGRTYFRNGTNVPDGLFLQHGLKPLPRNKRVNVDDGDRIIGFSYRDTDGKPVDDLQFYYVFGSLGAQGYEIRIYKSLLVRYVFFVHRWVS
jgi:hypothetical protein